MTRAPAIEALASPRRRELLRLLLPKESRRGVMVERTAGDLHRALPDAVTFGAVSQHLRVLRKAGLVRVRREGRHRFYQADADAVGPHLEWLQELWRDALYRLKLEVELEQARRGPRQRGPRQRGPQSQTNQENSS